MRLAIEMKSWWKFFPAFLLAIIAVTLARQWQTRVELLGELAEWRGRQAELAGLRLENQRLTASQVSPAELENLRADHAAIGRLREELDALKALDRAAAGPAP